MDTGTAVRNELTQFVDALADVERLRLAGFLANGPLDVVALGQHVGLADRALRRHLRVLMRAGVVEEGDEGFRLNAAHLRLLSRRVHATDRAEVSAVDRDLRPFLDASGRVLALPVHVPKLRLLLHHVAQGFEPGRRYTEREVNAVLAEVTNDFFTLRRLLVDHGELARERDGSAYWRVETA